MGSNWQTFTVEQLVSLNILDKPIDGNHGEIHPKSSDFISDGIPFIMASDLKGGTVDVKNCKFISLEQAKTLRKGFARKNDVLLSHKATLGRTAVVGEIKTDFLVLTPQVTYYRVRNLNKLNPFYLKYYFDSKEFQRLLDQWGGGGSTRLYLGITGQLKLPINLPSIEIQNYIVDNIDALDQKITLNRQINQTLEQMAQTLFKSWFVDFDPVLDNALDAGNAIPDSLQDRAEQRRAVRAKADFKPLPTETRALFPAEFEETELGWVPKGWEVKRCEEIAEKIGMGPFGSNIKVETFVSEGVPVISGKHLHGKTLYDIDYNYITNEHAEKISNSLVYPDDLVFTHAGNIGQVSLITNLNKFSEYIISQRQFYMRPNKSKVYPSYLIYFFTSTEGQHKLLSNASQVGVPSIARPSTHLKNIELVIPCLFAQQKFDSVYRDIQTKMFSLRSQSSSLINLRDSLLPKLISGELSLEALPEVLPAADASI